MPATPRHTVRWRWGQCPRCDADAWTDSADPLNVACSRACRGYSIWDWLESVYSSEQRFGAVFALRSFDDSGRPANTGETPP